MELTVVAPGAGVVAAVLVSEGELVSGGQRLIEVEA
jgi:biotin carboxyl carrier protein